MDNKKGLAQHTVFYIMANGVEASVPFLLAPILTRTLDQTDYGIWVLFITYATFLRPFIGLTAQDAIRMRFYDFDQKQLEQFTHTLFFVMLGVMAIGAAVALLFRDTLAAISAFPAEWVVSIVIAAFLFEMFYSVLALQQFHGRHVAFFTIQVIQAVLSLGFISALLLSGWSWEGVVVGRMLGLACAVLVALVMLGYRPAKMFRVPRRSFYRSIAKFGLFYAPSGMVIMAMALLDKLIAVHFLGVEAGALYGIAALFASAFWVLNNSFLLAWTPWLFRHLRGIGAEDEREILTVSMLYFVIATLAAGAILLVSLWIAPLLLGARFHEAIPLMPYIMLAILLQGFFMHNMKFLHHDKRILLMSLLSFFALGLNAVLSVSWVSSMGVAGIMIATAVSFGAAFLLSGALLVSTHLHRRKGAMSVV